MTAIAIRQSILEEAPREIWESILAEGDYTRHELSNIYTFFGHTLKPLGATVIDAGTPLEFTVRDMVNSGEPTEDYCKYILATSRLIYSREDRRSNISYWCCDNRECIQYVRVLVLQLAKLGLTLRDAPTDPRCPEDLRDISTALLEVDAALVEYYAIKYGDDSVPVRTYRLLDHPRIWQMTSAMLRQIIVEAPDNEIQYFYSGIKYAVTWSRNTVVEEMLRVREKEMNDRARK